VLSGRGMQTALELGQSHGSKLSGLLRRKSVKHYISNELAMALAHPIRFVRPGRGGKLAVGYEATILPDICDAILQARKVEKLTTQEKLVADQCEILTRAFAKVGIIALVDEATGYQDSRAKDALARILEAFIAKELRKWVSTFPVDYYKELFRLRGWKFPNLPADQRKRPVLVGKLTNDIIYDRLAPGVRQELHRLTPRDDKGRLRHKLFQRLTDDVGSPKLREHLASVVALMKAADKWNQFVAMLNRALPRYNDTGYLPFEDA
jgi:P63C domain